MFSHFRLLCRLCCPKEIERPATPPGGEGELVPLVYPAEASFAGWSDLFFLKITTTKYIFVTNFLSNPFSFKTFLETSFP